MEGLIFVKCVLVSSGPQFKTIVYMRLSVIPSDTIMEYLNLTSSNFVIPIFRTALLNVLNDEDDNVMSQDVHCYEVQRYLKILV